MSKISGPMFMMKRGFPILWFGFLVAFVLVVLVSSIQKGAQPEDLFFLIGPLFMSVFGYVVMKRLIWDLVDEVYDHGDYLVVRNRGDEARIDLADIMNVSVSTFMNPQRVTLRLVRRSRFGHEISFSPARPFTLNPFASMARNEIAENLMVRVDQARSRRAI